MHPIHPTGFYGDLHFHFILLPDSSLVQSNYITGVDGFAEHCQEHSPEKVQHHGNFTAVLYRLDTVVTQWIYDYEFNEGVHETGVFENRGRSVQAASRKK